MVREYNRENALLRNSGACLRVPISPSEVSAAEGPKSVIHVSVRRYVARTSLSKCPGKNSNTRIFAPKDVVEIIWGADPTPDSDVWIVAHKKRVRNADGAVQLWKRQLRTVLECCDPEPFTLVDMPLPVDGWCTMRESPQCRSKNAVVRCAVISVTCKERIWVEDGLFPVVSSTHENNTTITNVGANVAVMKKEEEEEEENVSNVNESNIIGSSTDGSASKSLADSAHSVVTNTTTVAPNFTAYAPSCALPCYRRCPYQEECVQMQMPIEWFTPVQTVPFCAYPQTSSYQYYVNPAPYVVVPRSDCFDCFIGPDSLN